MREIISLKRLPLDAKNEGWESVGAGGTAFDGVVGPERVRLRVEAWLHDAPRELAARVRVELSGTAAGKPMRVEVVGAVEGVWPTG
jgi:hypothetical protein